jgi:hypothetical protein
MIPTAYRRWIYRAAVAFFPVAVFYGILDAAAAPLWLAAILALLNVPADE